MKLKNTLKKISKFVVEQSQYNYNCDMLLSQFSIKELWDNDVIIHLDKLTFI